MAARTVAQRAEHVEWTDVTKKQFSGRLRKIMDEKGISSNELAQRMREYLPKGETFATSNLSHYRQGRSAPRARYLGALSAALGVTVSDLVPAGIVPTAQDERLSGGAAVTRRPRPTRGRAGANVRGGKRAETLPIDQSASIVSIEDKGQLVHLKLDQHVTWDVALAILNLLKSSDSPA